jgi:methanogenic corrinoid protein MtbC1
MSVDLHQYVEDMVGHLVARSASGAFELVTGLADGGTPVTDILEHLIGPAQVEIGKRWHRDELSVADEHAATAVADAVVSVLAGTTAASTDGLRVVVTCAENEWHTISARLFSESLRLRGFDVTFLGPSLPPTHLARFLHHTPPDVLAVSCTTPLALEGVLACVHVARHAGIPVLVGGRALGYDPHRAQVLGADLWAPGPGTAARMLADRDLSEDLGEPTADAGTAIELALGRADHVDRSFEELERRFPPLVDFDHHQRARTREDLDYILQFVEAAVLVRDRRIFNDLVVWLRLIARSGGSSPGHDQPVEGVLSDLQDGPIHDDVAILAIGWHGPGATPSPDLAEATRTA